MNEIFKDSREDSRTTKQQLFLESMDQYARQDVAVAFSGGADSSLLLKAACQAAEKYTTKVYAVTIQTELHTAEDLETAKRVAEETGAYHMILHIDELKEAGIERNPIDRCYLCKKLLFSRLRENVEKLGVHTILEGTNADDLKEYRPGIRAIHELGIVSPLADAGMTKTEVRALAFSYGISVADRPASPCMATRFPYGTELTKEKMEAVKQGEAYLKSLGFYNVRLRVQEELARIEIDTEALNKALKYREEIVKFLKKLGYKYITLDLEGFRSGSMDIAQGKGEDMQASREQLKDKME